MSIFSGLTDFLMENKAAVLAKIPAYDAVSLAIENNVVEKAKRKKTAEMFEDITKVDMLEMVGGYMRYLQENDLFTLLEKASFVAMLRSFPGSAIKNILESSAAANVVLQAGRYYIENNKPIPMKAADQHPPSSNN